MKVILSTVACTELRHAHEHIARDNPVAALEEMKRILEAVQRLADTKADGREVVLRDGRSVRIWLVSSYKIYYRRTARALHIAHIFHQARRPIER